MFITFEGVEGSGKTTQSRLLRDYLISQGRDVIVTNEPGGSEGALAIRKMLLEGENSKWDGISELLLFSAARRDHVEKVIKPALNCGKVVICDRFYDSTMAYQGYARGLGKQIVEAATLLAIGNFKPDITFLIDIEIEDGINRVIKRDGKLDRFESMDIDFHQKIRNGFREIAKLSKDRIHIINGNRNIQEIHKEILEIAASQ